MGIGDGDWGLGIGDWAQSTIPNPQSPIPNPHLLKNKNLYKINTFLNFKFKQKNIFIALNYFYFNFK